jgi:hypothetical protein
MVIKEYSLSDLAQLALSGDFWRGEVIPITKHRALAQIKNPRARPEDVVLLIAYDGDTICGYIGVLPELIFLEGRGYRVGWLTAWWRRPDPKYAGLGLTLMLRACEVYRGAVGSSPPSAAAAKVFKTSKQLIPVNESTELQVFVRANMCKMLLRKFPSLKKFKLFLTTFDCLANILCEGRLCMWKRRHGISGKLRLEYIAEVDTETSGFIQQLQDADLHRRGAHEFYWIARWPWILSAPVNDGRDKRYYFAATANESLCLMVKVYDLTDIMIGFLMLRFIDGQLKIPYCYMRSNHADAMFRVIGEHVVALPVDTVTIGRAALRESLRRLKFPCLAKRKSAKSWIVGNVYGTKVSGQFEIQDGDGDCAFF